jgi:hypothetical protein
VRRGDDKARACPPAARAVPSPPIIPAVPPPPSRGASWTLAELNEQGPEQSSCRPAARRAPSGVSSYHGR